MPPPGEGCLDEQGVPSLGSRPSSATAGHTKALRESLSVSSHMTWGPTPPTPGAWLHTVHTQLLIFQVHSLGWSPCSPPTVKEIYFSHKFLLSSSFPETLMDLILINGEAGPLRAERGGCGNVSLERRRKSQKEQRPRATDAQNGASQSPLVAGEPD